MINDETLKNIENLHRLKTEGVITEEEFEKAKDGLLNGRSRPAPQQRISTPTTTDEEIGLPAPDDHFAWMILPLKRYADFNGRSTRKEYWMFLLLLNAVVLALGLLVLNAAMTTYEGPGPIAMFSIFAIIVIFLGSLIPLLAAEARRFHDQDMSGWLVAINLIPYLGAFIVLFFMALPGTKGENKYGPDPLA